MLNVLNYSLSKMNQENIEQLRRKVIVFIIPENPLQGAQINEIRFPFDGKIVDVFASCSIPGTTPSTLLIETIPLADVDNLVPNWVVSVKDIELPASQRTNKNKPTTITKSLINKDDYVRVTIPTIDSGVRNITVEVIVDIEI